MVAVGGWPGPAVGCWSQASMTVPIRCKIRKSNGNLLVQYPRFRTSKCQSVVRISQPSVVVKTASYTPEGGTAHPGDFKAQARAALQCLKAQVEAGGGTMVDIVKVN